MNSEDGVTAETLCILSAHEAEKILKDGCAFEGIVFFTYEAGISRERMEQNLNKVNQYGGMWSLENHVLYKNSLQYIFEQMSMLAPVLIGNLSLSWNGTCGQVVFDSEKLWYPDKDGTLHICNYDLKEEEIRKLSGCKRIAYDVQADFVYGVSETGSIVKADSEGNIDELCRPEGFAVREIVPAGTELIWKGLTETDEKSPVWGTVSLADGEETHQIRTDGGGYRLCPITGGAVIADADGYDPNNVS